MGFSNCVKCSESCLQLLFSDIGVIKVYRLIELTQTDHGIGGMISRNVGESFRKHLNLRVLVTFSPLLRLVWVLSETWHQVGCTKNVNVTYHGGL